MPSRPMRFLRAGSFGGLALLPIGALGTRVGLWHPRVGLGLFALGALAVLACGVLAVFASRARRRRGEAGPAFTDASIFAAALLLLWLFPFARSALTTPPIHQVSTDVIDPPAFSRVVSLRGPDANPIVLTPETVEAQREHYPWVRTLVVPRQADAAFATALRVIEELMVLEVVGADPTQRVIEATDSTFWFGFKDDVVVRIRFGERGTLVDVRSISRFGGGDLGVNADRVGEFFRLFLIESGLDAEVSEDL